MTARERAEGVVIALTGMPPSSDDIAEQNFMHARTSTEFTGDFIRSPMSPRRGRVGAAA